MHKYAYFIIYKCALLLSLAFPSFYIEFSIIITKFEEVQRTIRSRKYLYMACRRRGRILFVGQRKKEKKIEAEKQKKRT